MADTGYNRFDGWIASNWNGYENLIVGGVGIADLYIAPPNGTTDVGRWGRTQYRPGDTLEIPEFSTIDEIYIRASQRISTLDSSYRLTSFQTTSSSVINIGTLLGLSYVDYTQGGPFDSFWGLTQAQAYEFVMGDGNTEFLTITNEKVGASTDLGNVIEMDELLVRVVYTPPPPPEQTLIFPPVL